jgi:hypothetical protein
LKQRRFLFPQEQAGAKKMVKRVTYILISEYHNLGIDKKDILSAELEACKELLIDTTNDTERKIIWTEITQLEGMLGMIS